MRTTHRTTRIGLAAAVLVGLTALPAHAASGFDPTNADARLGGADRYETAATIAEKSWGSARTVIVANGERNGIDALAASYLAGVLDAPVLLTTKSGVPTATADALRALDPRSVVVVGAEGSVSAQAMTELTRGREARRIGGADRFETAAQILTAGVELSGHAPVAVFIARGDLYDGQVASDALAAAPIAYRAGVPVLLTDPKSLPSATRNALQGLGVSNVHVLGSTAAVSRTTASAAASAAGVAAVQRLAGSDSSATAFDIAESPLAVAAGLSRATVGIANSGSIDALAAGIAAGKGGYPLLVTATAQDLGSGTRAYLQRHAATLTGSVVFGNSQSVAPSALQQARSEGGGSPAPAPNPPATNPPVQPEPELEPQPEPEPEIVRPDAVTNLTIDSGTTVVGQQVTLTFDAVADGTLTVLRRPGAEPDAEPVVVTQTASGASVTFTAETVGSFRYSVVRTVDGVDSLESSAVELTVSADPLTPTVTNALPISAARVARWTIGGTAPEGVTKVRIDIDGHSNRTVTVRADRTWALSYSGTTPGGDFSGFADGAIPVLVTGLTATGSESVPARPDVVKDTIVGAPTLDGPVLVTRDNRTEVVIAGTVDPDVTKVTGKVRTSNVTAVVENGRFVVRYNARSVPLGDYPLELKATDAAGNVNSLSDAEGLHIVAPLAASPGTPRSMTAGYIVDWAAANATDPWPMSAWKFSGKANDPGADRVRYTIDGITEEFPVTDKAYAGTMDLSGLAEGVYSVDIEALSRDGIVSEVVTKSFTKNLPPRLTHVTAVNGSWRTAGDVLRLQFTEGVSFPEAPLAASHLKLLLGVTVKLPSGTTIVPRHPDPQDPSVVELVIEGAAFTTGAVMTGSTLVTGNLSTWKDVSASPQSVRGVGDLTVG